MNIFSSKVISIVCVFFLVIGFFGASWAQPCADTKELLLLPGKHVESKSNSIGGYVSDFSGANKTNALKELTKVKSIAINNFKLYGGQAQSNFNFLDKYYFGSYFHGSYQYRLSFYQFMCVNGKQVTSDEYGNDLLITINPPMNYFFTPPTSDYETGFYANGETATGPLIEIFRYLTFDGNISIDDLIAGEQYVEQYKGGSDAYDKQGDIHRIWYFSQKDKKVLTTVTRKEYLKNLLVFYDLELLKLGKKQLRLLNEAKEYMAKYEKNGNKQMYQSHLENKTRVEKELELMKVRKDLKAGIVLKLLQSQSEEWLKQPARIDPGIRNNSYCESADDFKATGYFTFRSFSDDPRALIIYKWNETYFKQHLSAPAEPLLISVRLRYKKDNAFSAGILNGYMSGLDLKAIQKLVAHQ